MLPRRVDGVQHASVLMATAGTRRLAQGVALAFALLSCGPEATQAVGDGEEPVVMPSEPKLVRLTHQQYERTLSDLFGWDDVLERGLPPDARNGFVFDSHRNLEVDGRLGPEYRSIAERAAERAVYDGAVYSALVPCNTNEVGCAAQFVSDFGLKAFRRPLEVDEQEAFEGLFTRGAALFDGGDAFRDGVRITLEAMLQSPQFLYRVQLPSEANLDQLSGYELASRLSYLLWDSMPDEELFEAARRGHLEDEELLRVQIQRLLESPRALEKLTSFHAQLWDFGRMARIRPDPMQFPQAPLDLASRARHSAERFVEEVVEEGGGLRELLTSPFAYADAVVAPLYGLESSAPVAERLELSEARPGLLTQVGHLAANAYALETDPIHRGLFVLRNILCRTIPEPPPEAATATLPQTDEPLVTTRQRVAALTGQGSCPACHARINPPGFAFEGFDAAGRVRDSDRGEPVDTRGEMRLDGKAVEFSDARELVQALADSEEARLCYARRMVEFAQGRALREHEQAWVERLAAPAAGSLQLLEELAGSAELRRMDWGVP